jgi:uncharacterized protein
MARLLQAKIVRQLRRHRFVGENETVTRRNHTVALTWIEIDMRKLMIACTALLITLVGGMTAAMAQTAHKVAIQVNTNDAALMNLALNNAQNVIAYYKAKNETVDVQVVTYGPGLHMLRDDTSPVKSRVATMSLENPNLKFAACQNTLQNMTKAENKDIEIVSEGKMVPSGVITLIELQKQGYAYIRP